MKYSNIISVITFAVLFYVVFIIRLNTMLPKIQTIIKIFS